MIRWADGRASLRVVPEFVREEWGIDLETADADAIGRLKGGTECPSDC
jgi:hypothetical protein